MTIKVTTNSLLSDALQVLFTIALGFFMLVTAAVIVFKFADARHNVNELAKVDIVAEGRVHVYDSYEFTRSVNGESRKCVAVQTADKTQWKDVTVSSDGSPVAPSAFCDHLFGTYLSNWQQYAHDDSTSFGEKLFWSILLGLVIFAAGYLIAYIPAALVSLALTPLIPYVRFVTIVFLIPIVICVLIFLSAAWSYTPKGWFPPHESPVETTRVFIARDGSLYRAPDTLYDWSDTSTGNKMLEKYPE